MLNSSDLLTGKLVRLAAPQPDDNQAIARWSNDAEYHRFLDDDPTRPVSAEQVADSAREREKDEERRGKNFEYRIRTLADDKLIGFTGLWVWWPHQTAWLGIGIGEADYRDKGYGTDAFRLIVNYGFRELNLYRIQLGVFSYNTRARHVYAKCGFVFEGTQRAVICRDGQRHDVHLMGILRPEWEALQESMRLSMQPSVEMDEAQNEPIVTR